MVAALTCVDARLNIVRHDPIVICSRIRQVKLPRKRRRRSPKVALWAHCFRSQPAAHTPLDCRGANRFHIDFSPTDSRSAPREQEKSLLGISSSNPFVEVGRFILNLFGLFESVVPFPALLGNGNCCCLVSIQCVIFRHPDFILKTGSQLEFHVSAIQCRNDECCCLLYTSDAADE